ncbi:CCA tRNA nucleotidyltransferase [Haloarculaceae archaeon H-GB11]|nr:CCA tRNA nucleotidyltransferase [Haloarculaceae archaeon H-GB11]
MSDEFDAVVERVGERVTPDADERERLATVADQVMDRARAALEEIPVDAEVVQVGSTARGTWIAGDRDIDVFVCFPPSLDRDQLESYGLDVGHSVLPDGHEEFAEHPYVVGEIEGFSVDLVPCYAVDTASDIKSAVDRTPFHTRYLESRLTDDLAAAVRVAKQFLKGIGAYGSDLRTRGFSGYLVELLVLEYGDVRAFIEAASDWTPPVEFDPEDHGDKTFDDPLVVIDPTDPERNVAAALSAANVARVQHYARELLADPREELFVAEEPEPLTDAEAREVIDDRGTTPVAVRFDAPDLVDDQLYPQLEKSKTGLKGELDRRGFDVLRAAAFADETVALLLECEVVERPAVERHEGPPVHVRQHATGFFEAYESDPDAYGPFIDGDRYVVEREREFRTVSGLLESDALFDVALGAHVESALEDGYEVLVGDEVAALVPEFGVDLARYCSPKP